MAHIFQRTRKRENWMKETKNIKEREILILEVVNNSNLYQAMGSENLGHDKLISSHAKHKLASLYRTMRK